MLALDAWRWTENVQSRSFHTLLAEICVVADINLSLCNSQRLLKIGNPGSPNKSDQGGNLTYAADSILRKCLNNFSHSTRSFRMTRDSSHGGVGRGLVSLPLEPRQLFVLPPLIEYGKSDPV